MSELVTASCGNCRFHYRFGQDDTMRTGLCRRHAPTAGREKFPGMAVPVFPDTDITNYCGDYETCLPSTQTPVSPK